MTDPATRRRKLVETKERWAAEGRAPGRQHPGDATGRLPPGQHIVKDWPVLDLGILPEISTSAWRLAVDGEVEHRFDWDWAVLMAQPQVGRNYLIALDGLDEMTVKVELADAGFDGQVEHLLSLQSALAEKLRAEILVKPRVELLPAGSLPVTEGKAIRVQDNRKL